MWRILALILSYKPIARWIINRAKQHPYSPIMSYDGSDLYMGRWWLFNAYADNASYRKWLPSIRVHWIVRPDRDRHLHNHPWNARTFILDGWYIEKRIDGYLYGLEAGDTKAIKHTDFHKITYVPVGGVWTLFITYRKQHDWGFLVPNEEYLE